MKVKVKITSCKINYAFEANFTIHTAPNVNSVFLIELQLCCAFYSKII